MRQICTAKSLRQQVLHKKVPAQPGWPFPWNVLHLDILILSPISGHWITAGSNGFLTTQFALIAFGPGTFVRDHA